MHLPRAWLGSALSIAALPFAVTVAHGRRHATAPMHAARAIAALLALCGMCMPIPSTALAPQWSIPLETIACPEPSYVSTELRPMPDGHLLLRTRNEVLRVGGNGVVIWRHTSPTPCPQNDIPGDTILDAADDSHGRVWIVERRGAYFPVVPGYSVTLHRLDTTGAVIASLALPADADARRVTSVRLTAIGSGMLALVTRQHPQSSHLPRLTWMRFDANGAIAAQFDIPIENARDTLAATALDTLADGDVRLVARHQVQGMCPPTHPCDSAERRTVIRFTPDGSERWRYMSADLASDGAAQTDGSAWFVHGDGALERVAADGTAFTPVVNSPVDASEEIYAVHGPIAQRLLRTSSSGMRLLTTDGMQVAARLIPTAPVWDDVNWNVHQLATTQQGFLLPLSYSQGDCALALLLHPASLQERLRFDSGHACDDTAALAFESSNVVTLPDGSVYMATRMHPYTGGLVRGAPTTPPLELLHFGLPGTPVGGLLYRDDFEQ